MIGLDSLPRLFHGDCPKGRSSHIDQSKYLRLNIIFEMDPVFSRFQVRRQTVLLSDT